MTEPKIRNWRVEIPQRRPKDSAQVHQTLFLLEGGVWGRDYMSLATNMSFLSDIKNFDEKSLKSVDTNLITADGKKVDCLHI